MVDSDLVVARPVSGEIAPVLRALGDAASATLDSGERHA